MPPPDEYNTLRSSSNAKPCIMTVAVESVRNAGTKLSVASYNPLFSGFATQVLRLDLASIPRATVRHSALPPITVPSLVTTMPEKNPVVEVVPSLHVSK